MDSPLWLTRPDDIQAHLIYASTEIPSAVLTVANLQVHGRLAPPEEDSGQVAFIVDSSLEGLVNSPPPGRALKVEYEGDEDAFTFYSEMVGTDLLKRWVLAAPKTVERTNQRLVARHLVSGNPDFGLSATLPMGRMDLAMRDVSNAGLSFSLAARDAPALGAMVPGTLEVPGLQPLGLNMEIRHVRPMPGDATRSLIGVKFIDLAHAERTALARALAAWHHERRRS
jgi:hypothetical protein